MNLYPVRCYTCNSVIKQLRYEKLMFERVFNSIPIAQILCSDRQFICTDPSIIHDTLEKMEVKRICCRRMYMGFVYQVSLDDLMHHHTLHKIWNDNKDSEFAEPYKTLVKNDGKRVKLAMKKMEAKYPDIKFDIVKNGNVRIVLPVETVNLKRISESPRPFYMKSAFDYFVEKNEVEYVQHSDIVVIVQPMLG